MFPSGADYAEVVDELDVVDDVDAEYKQVVKGFWIPACAGMVWENTGVSQVYL